MTNQVHCLQVQSTCKQKYKFCCFWDKIFRSSKGSWAIWNFLKWYNLNYRTNQKAGGVVQEAAEATNKAPLQEGGVLWGKLLRTVQLCITTTLQVWDTKDITYKMYVKLTSYSHRGVGAVLKCLIFYAQFLPSPLAAAVGGFRAKWSCCLNRALSSVWMRSNTLWWTTSDCRQRRQHNTSTTLQVIKRWAAYRCRLNLLWKCLRWNRGNVFSYYLAKAWLFRTHRPDEMTAQEWFIS